MIDELRQSCILCSAKRWHNSASIRGGLSLPHDFFILSTIQHGFLCALFKCKYYDFLYSLHHHPKMSSYRRYSSVAEARNNTVKYSRVKRSNTPVEPGRSGRPTINDCTQTAQMHIGMEVLRCACASTNACISFVFMSERTISRKHGQKTLSIIHRSSRDL